MLGLKQEGKSFPINQDVGVLKWRLQTTDESMMPLSSESHHIVQTLYSLLYFTRGLFIKEFVKGGEGGGGAKVDG